MVSRKKNKGKERKAKQAEKEAKARRLEVRRKWHGWARGKVDDEIVTLCNHGRSALPDENHPVSCFIDSYFVNCGNWDMSSGKNLLDLFTNHRQVLEDKSYRDMALQILILIGTNIMIGSKHDAEGKYKGLAYATQIIAVLEYSDGGSDFLLSCHNRVTASKRRDTCYIGSSARRDLLKFFSKRISCSCLKEMHSEARKSLLKMGQCDSCGVINERASLMVCSRCRISQFCSRKCQVEGWHDHKTLCSMFVNAHQKSTTIRAQHVQQKECQYNH